MTPELDRRGFLRLAGPTAVVAAGGGATGTAAPSPSTAASATASPAPKATGRISIYSALNESTNNQLFAAFTKATGVEVAALPLAAAGDLQTKITAEKNNPQADIFVGGSSEFHDPLGKQGLLEAYQSPNAKDVAAQFKEASGLWTGEAAGAPNWSHDILTEKAKDPSRIDLTVPADTGFEVGAVSIVKGTKNLLGAQAFVDWVLTKEAGDLNTKLSNRGSVRTDVAPAPGAPTLTSVTLVNYDRQWATDNKTRIQKDR